jgi:hypothetical protein
MSSVGSLLVLAFVSVSLARTVSTLAEEFNNVPDAIASEQAQSDGVRLNPTAHAAVPQDHSLLWLAPTSGTGGRKDSSLTHLSSGVTLFRAGKYEAALRSFVSNRPSDARAANYNAYYLAPTQLQLRETGRSFAD